MSAINGRRIVSVISGFLLLSVVIVLITALYMRKEMKTRLAGGWFLPPVEMHTSGRSINLGQYLDLDQFRQELSRRDFRERFEGQSLRANDFAVLDTQQCQDVSGSSFLSDTARCVVFRSPELPFGPAREEQTHLIAVNDSGQVVRIFAGEQMTETDSLRMPPQMFAQFYNDQPILRRIVHIGEVPLQCLQAVTAIEDSDFLEHKGVSFVGLFRAFVRNVIEGRYAQGGSTITQQLVKNYFLTPEKTIRRKIMEMFMAVILESEVDKDKILENYLNVVYMGQHGPFQVIGFGIASEFYFGKKITSLDLSECALLAAIINSPGRYNPLTSAENAIARRKLVLERMESLNLITVAEATLAKDAPLPKSNARTLTEPAPYFTQAIFRELQKLNISRERGLRVFTSLNEHAQELAQKAVIEHVTNLEKSRPYIKELKEAGKDLQASLISIDVRTGEVVALVGGRRYSNTQYNRILEAHRQVGSLMKPFVYLAAFETQTPTGEQYTPLTLIEDKPFTHKYDGQSWAPRNYTKEFNGTVPLFAALKDSMNAATAALGITVGLDNVLDVGRRAGMTSPMEPFPSLTLGAFEIYPIEIAEAYLTLARFGQHLQPQLIQSVEDFNANELYRAPMVSDDDIAFAADNVGLLVGMMTLTMDQGTGRVARLLGFNKPAAGKTGTTNDTKDTWFAGFTPDILTVTWTGYDDNTETRLSGASGALPLWAEFMKRFPVNYGNNDFKWPKGLNEEWLSPEDYRRLVPYDKNPPIDDVRVMTR